MSTRCLPWLSGEFFNLTRALCCCIHPDSNICLFSSGKAWVYFCAPQKVFTEVQKDLFFLPLFPSYCNSSTFDFPSNMTSEKCKLVQGQWQEASTVSKKTYDRVEQGNRQLSWWESVTNHTTRMKRQMKYFISAWLMFYDCQLLFLCETWTCCMSAGNSTQQRGSSLGSSWNVWKRTSQCEW